MKKRLLMLLSLFMAITSVGWVQGQETSPKAAISMDLSVAKSGAPIVVGVTTVKGDVADNTLVRVKLAVKKGTKPEGATAVDLSGWKLKYYETQAQSGIGWKEWKSEDGVYMYGPTTGFPLMNGTSYFELTPPAGSEGLYFPELSVLNMKNNEVVVGSGRSFTVSTTPESVEYYEANPLSSIGNTFYTTLPHAVRFAESGSTIKLTSDAYRISQMLVIDKPLTIEGKKTGSKVSDIQCMSEAEWVIPEGAIESEYKHLVYVGGDATGTVTLKNMTVISALASGINAQSAMTTVLDNVELVKNTNAGLLVHSTVKATGLRTDENKWGGVNISKSTKTNYPTSFTFDATSTFKEATQIWSEITDNDKIVAAPAEWKNYLGTGGAGNATAMRFWTNKSLIPEFYQQFPNKATWKEGYTFVYANGKPITITEGSAAGKVKISLDGTDEELELETAKNPVIFGGAKNATVASSCITMESGQVMMLFGGGYGETNGSAAAATEEPARVTDSTTITVVGGTVANSLFGGGLYYSHSKKVTINLSGKVSVGGTANWLICGGFESGQTKGTAYGEFATSNNTVESATLTINGGTYAYIAIGGTDGDKGYIKQSTATVKNAKIVGGVFGNGSNGRSDLIKGSFENCTFEKGASGYPIEIAGVNRGKSKNISFAFKNCTFPSNAADIYTYLGGTHQWGQGYASSEIGIPESVSFTFEGGTNLPVVGVSSGLEAASVALTGAKGKVASFAKNSSTNIKDFTIPAGKTWVFNGGLEVAEGSTLTNNGTLGIPAANIMTAIAAGGALQVNATATVVIAEMNKATGKKDLSTEDITIACIDAVIATKKETAKELLKAGKNVQLLAFATDTYSATNYAAVLATITNLPTSVVYGTAPVKLAFNPENVKVAIEGSTSDVAALKDGILTIKKPGDIKFNLTVEGDADATNTQTLTVTKRTVTLTEGLTATEKVYDGNTTITLSKSTYNFAGTLNPEAFGLTLVDTPTGVLTDANAGDTKSVTVTATLSGDSAAWYELAPITFVKAKVTPKPLTLTAAAKERNYGEENPAFTVADYSLVGEDKLEGALKFNCSATATSLAEVYDITPYGLTSPNYKITYAAGKLTVKAIAPVIEMVEAKTVLKSDNTTKEIQLKAKLINTGGAKEITSVKFVQNSTDVTATLADGYYTGKFDVASGTTYSITASATATDKTGTSKALEVVIDALKPQVLSFAPSVLPTMVYGSEMSLGAVSNMTAATGAYTYSLAEGNGATITGNTLKATKAGKITLTAKRAADATHSAAVATRTIEIMPKPITVEVGTISKVYDGTTTVSTLPSFNLQGVIEGDAVSIDEGNIPAAFANKNVGTPVVILPALTLTGDAAANYTLIQPASKKGEIKKAPLTVKVNDVTRMWNDRYTKYEFASTGLVNGETLSAAYSGSLDVAETAEGKLTLKVNADLCPNYTLTAEGGTLTINKGNPTAVVYGTSSSINPMLIDAAGYTGLTTVVEGAFATIRDAQGNTIGRSFNSIGSTVVTTSVQQLNTRAATKATSSWDIPTPTKTTYGATTLDVKYAEAGCTYQSTDPNILTIDNDGSSYAINGTGTVAIIAISSTATHVLKIQVDPKPLTVSSTMNKVYDGTTLTTGTVVLTGADGADVALDLSGSTFNFDKKGVDATTIIPSQAFVLTGSAANNYSLNLGLKGKISPKELKITNVNKYYDGLATATTADYAAEGLVSGETVPAAVTFKSAAAGAELALTNPIVVKDANYTLGSGTPTGVILKSTFIATLPATAPSKDVVAGKVTFAIRETGVSVANSPAIGYQPTVEQQGDVYYVSGGNTDNYSVVYTSNQIGFKSEGGGDNPGGGTDPEATTITLDATTKVLPRTETFVLTATVTPAGQTVTWSSSDPAIASVTADGNKVTVKALKVGEATITATIGSVTASCVVTVDFATDLEEAIAATRVYAQNGSIRIEPQMPMDVAVVNMVGQVIYNGHITGASQIAVSTSGIYIVKLGAGNDAKVHKVSVK